MSSSRLQRTAAAALSGVLLLALAGCGDDETTADPDPTEAPSSTHTASASPTADPSAWTSDYTEAEVKAFDAALRRFDAYEKASEPIWAAGKATPAAKKLFKEYFPSPNWEAMYRELQMYETADVQTTGRAAVLWSEPTHLTKGSALIRQCVDYDPMETVQRGSPAPRIESRADPVLREINLSKPEGYDWLIYSLNTAPGKDEKDIPCDPK